MKKDIKISKGYRLKPETHRLIKQIQKCIRGSLDDSINIACKKLLQEIKKNSSLEKNHFFKQ